MKKYNNLPNSPEHTRNIFKWLRFLIRRATDKPPNIPGGHIINRETVLHTLNENPDNVITWLGHDTFIIRTSGITVLTDPFFAKYASPLQGIGIKRYAPAPIPVNKLPSIDIVTVSHDHYDHFDYKPLQTLKNKPNVQIITPLGLGKYFRKAGFSQITELNWHEHWHNALCKITATPAVHFSKRHLLTRNTHLWTSYVMEIGNIKFFFAGDTAYHDSLFKEIGRQFGPIDYALLPIGAYAPRQLMSPIHINPQEAVKIAKDLQAKTLIAMHWGTIQLSDEPCFEPPQLFKQHAQEQNYDEENVWVLNIGETRTLRMDNLDRTFPS